MVSGERTGPKNLTIPHADTWVRWELLKINNVRLHYGAGFHQWMGYLRYPLKFETAAVCEETEKETMLSISNLRHAMYLIFVVAACLFCWGRRWCVVWFYWFVFLFMVICFLFVCLLACLFFCRCVCSCCCCCCCCCCFLFFFSGCKPIPNLQSVPLKIPKMFGVMSHKVYILL